TRPPTRRSRTSCRSSRVEARRVGLRQAQPPTAGHPAGRHPLLGEFNTRNYVGWPSETDTYASADPTQPNIVQILTS
ncbi:hypothetical protein CTI14_63650, partial [Methylobacterium radiotolerans]